MSTTCSQVTLLPNPNQVRGILPNMQCLALLGLSLLHTINYLKSLYVMKTHVDI